MSSSEEDSKIDLLDSPAAIKKKLQKAFCEPGNVEDNGVLAFIEHVLFPLVPQDEGILVERPEKYGGNVSYYEYRLLEAAFVKQELHPGDLKSTVEKYLKRLLEPIRRDFSDPKLKELVKNAYPPPVVVDNRISMARLDIRVGKIVSVEKHEEADSLYVSRVDVGEPEPRTVVIGLANTVPAEELRGRQVVVLCNLHPALVRGVSSSGMVLCASRDSPKCVELLDPPPDGSAPGDKVYVEGQGNGVKDQELVSKKKVFEKLQADLNTSKDCVAQWKGKNLMTNLGVIRSHSLSGVPIK